MFVRTLLILSVTTAVFAQPRLNVELVGQIYDQQDIRFRVRDVVVLGDFAYVAFHFGLKVVDVSDPEHPEEVGGCGVLADEVRIFGSYAYTTSRTGIFSVISIADPENPEVVGDRIYGDGFAYGLAISGDYVYLTAYPGLHVISIVDPEHHEVVGSFDTQGVGLGIAVDGEYAYIASDRIRNGEEYVGGGLRILSIDDPEHPEEVGFWDTYPAIGVTVSGDHAYLVGLDLHIISIDDPEHPEEVGFLDTYMSYRVAVSGDHAYLASDTRGMRVINIADPEHPREVGYFDTRGTAWGVAVSEDGLIYVADESNLGIYRFTEPDKVDGPSDTVPVSFNLSPAYPNPFNSTTMIAYQLPNSGQVSLQVYNLSGERMSTLYEDYGQSGAHEVALRADGWASGVYLARLQIGTDVRTQRLVLVR